MTPDLDTIYREHYRRVYSICLKMLHSVEDAEDLTQEVFLHVDRKLHTFRGDAALSTWLHRVTVNCVLMFMRTRKTKAESVSIEDVEDLVAKLPVSGLSAGRMIDLNDAIGRLPHGYKTALILHDVEGYDHQEMAQITGRSVGTMKSQTSKARRKMVRLLGRRANPRVSVFA